MESPGSNITGSKSTTRKKFIFLKKLNSTTTMKSSTISTVSNMLANIKISEGMPYDT